MRTRARLTAAFALVACGSQMDGDATSDASETGASGTTGGGSDLPAPCDPAVLPQGPCEADGCSAVAIDWATCSEGLHIPRLDGSTLRLISTRQPGTEVIDLEIAVIDSDGDTQSIQMPGFGYSFANWSGEGFGRGRFDLAVPTLEYYDSSGVLITSRELHTWCDHVHTVPGSLALVVAEAEVGDHENPCPRTGTIHTIDADGQPLATFERDGTLVVSSAGLYFTTDAGLELRGFAGELLWTVPESDPIVAAAPLADRVVLSDREGGPFVLVYDGVKVATHANPGWYAGSEISPSGTFFAFRTADSELLHLATPELSSIDLGFQPSGYSISDLGELLLRVDEFSPAEPGVRLVDRFGTPLWSTADTADFLSTAAFYPDGSAFLLGLGPAARYFIER